MRSAVLRYVARHAAVEDWVNLRKVLSSTFMFFSGLGLLVVLITLVLAWRSETIFATAPEWQHTTKILILVLGLGSAVGFPISIFSGVLEGMQRFVWIGAIQTTATIVRALGILLALYMGKGIVAVGTITIVTGILASLFMTYAAFRVCPNLRISWADAEWSTLRILLSFGGAVFLITIAQQLRFQSDAVVIGSFISVGAVGVFAIGAKLVAYGTDTVQAMAQVFTPIFSHLEALQDRDELRRTLILGNRSSSMIAFPLTVGLVLGGRAFIRAWVGNSYATTSYPVLVVLAIPTMFYLAQAGSTKLLYGIGKHRTLALVLLAEGLGNLGLSIPLGIRLGIIGVAIGTAIPLCFTSLVFLPRHVCRLANLPFPKYLTSAHLVPAVLCVPMALFMAFSESTFRPSRYGSLFLEYFVALTIYAATVSLYHRQALLSAMKSRSLNAPEGVLRETE
jgi:O-antigen/teichoic acid export membrane protein